MVSPFTYQRPVYFKDTDAGGVVYFAQLLSICHEAYEAALRSTGFDLRHFFGTAEVAVPIIHAEIDFFQPVYCGDILLVKFTAKVLNTGVFQLDYRLFREATSDLPLTAKALTKHSCITRSQRQKCPIPPNLRQWLEQWTETNG